MKNLFIRTAATLLALAGMAFVPALAQGKPASSAFPDGVAALREGRLDDAVALLRKAAGEQPANGITQFHLGIACFRASRWKEAVTALEQACKLMEHDPAPHEYLGQALMRMERWNDAERELREAARLGPENPRTLTTLGVVCLKLNRTGDAESLFRQALESDHEYPAALYNIAFLEYKWLAKPSDAKAHFEKFIHVSGDANRISVARAALARIAGKREIKPPARTPAPAAAPAPAAVKKPATARRAAEPAVVPVAGGRPVAINETRAGVECFRNKSIAAAVDHFKRAISADASYDVAHYNLGLACEAQGRTRDAIQSFREAWRINPGKSEAAYALANAYWKSGNPDAATPVLGKLISADPACAKAYFLLGFISERTSGPRDVTRRYYQSYLKLQKTGEHADYARKWLAGNGAES